ncbi:hypothetical protein [Streptomyces sp. NPDC005423]|uniref:hypothetical protein n=1 Tax=Streptomyces sp. NPDC005423 TaxID=3155343 RepID=UPI0033B9A634
MDKRPLLPEEFRAEARTAFGFLVDDEGFRPPEEIDGGLRYRRTDLMVRIWFLGGAESEVLTRVIPLAPDGTRGSGAWLDDLYAGTGCGRPRDVPAFASTRRAVLRRVHQHAEALRRLLPCLPVP